MTEQAYSPGLAGVVAGETAICCVEQGQLLYRGYPIHELADSVSFEDIAHLLLFEALPNAAGAERIRKAFFEYRKLPDALVETLRAIPGDVSTMDVLRTTVSLAGHFDPINDSDFENEAEASRERSLWITAQIAAIIAARLRIKNGKEPLEPKEGLSHAAQLLYQCHGEVPDELSARLIDLSLILYAEHDFNASTFTCRVIGSSLSDLISSVVGAIGSLKGPLHGGANEASMQMLKQFTTPEEAQAWIENALARREKVMGFGHRVYRNGDHRADILDRELRKLAEQKGEENWVAIYDTIRLHMLNEKKIFMNMDYPIGLIFYLLGLPLDLYSALFVASRVTGWCAHFIEQHADNKLYRPLSVYTGPPLRSVPPVDQR